MPDDSHNRDAEPGRPIPHGTTYGYDTHGCRDRCCRDVKHAYEQELRERKRGWGFIDDVAVERACKGDRTVRLTPYEMRAAFQQLDGRGLSARQIAGRLGVSERSVVRWRNGHVTRPHGTDRRKAS